MPHRFFNVEFRWNDWNREQVAKHGLSESEVEHVVRFAPRGYPRNVGGRWLVIGKVPTGETIEVVFVEDAFPDETIYVIHAMPR